tara:strand:+ start:520 stop:684 length:165 start_codon:yes stop_codon:yes gene_type:complete
MSNAWENGTKVEFANKVIEILEDYDTWINLEENKDEAFDRICQAAIASQGVDLG